MEKGLDPCGPSGRSEGAFSSTPGSGGVGQQQRAMEPANLPLQLRLTRRMEQAVTLFSILLQLALYRRSATVLTLRQHANQAALLTLRGICWMAATYLPVQSWLKYRVLLIGTMRLAIAIVPSQRTAQEGDAALLLNRPATPGTLGAFQDLLRLVTGTRLLPMALIGAMLQQPPLAVLVQQVLLMLVTSDNNGFCSTQLLTQPLTRQRISAVCRQLDVWTPMLAPTLLTLEGSTWAGISGDQLDQLRCVAVLTFLQIVIGVLVPVLVAGFTAPAALEAPEEQPPQHPCQPAEEPSTGPSVASIRLRRRAASRSAGSWKATGRWVQRMVAAAVAPFARLDAALQEGCRQSDGLARLTLLADVALLVANLWQLAKQNAVVQVGPSRDRP